MRQSFAVTGMHCASCGLLIDEALEELPGIDRAQTDLRHGRTTVDGERIDTDAIITVIEGLGFQAAQSQVS